MWYVANDGLSHYTLNILSQALEYPMLPAIDRLGLLRMLMHGSVPQDQVGPIERSVVAVILFLLWLSSLQPLVSIAVVALLVAGPAVVGHFGRGCCNRCLLCSLCLATELYFAALVTYAALPPVLMTNPQDAKLLAPEILVHGSITSVCASPELQPMESRQLSDTLLS